MRVLAASVGAAVGSFIGYSIDSRRAARSEPKGPHAGPVLLVLTSERLLVLPSTARGVPLSEPVESFPLPTIADASTTNRVRLGITTASMLSIQLIEDSSARSFGFPGGMNQAKTRFVNELRSLVQRTHH